MSGPGTTQARHRREPGGDLEESAAQAGPAGRPGQAGRALAWSLANTAAGRLGTLAIGIVLARLLGPSEFGTYAVAFVALMAMLSFNELGVSLAIVRWQRDPAEIAPTVNTLSVAASLLVTLAAVLAAPWFATAMGDASATRCVQLLSLCVLLNGVVATPAALLQRAFRQDQRTVVDQLNTWLGAGVSVALAVAGVGAMSLVAGRLVGAGVSGLLLLRYSPVPYRFALDRRFVRPLLSFGLPLAGSSVVVFLVGFLDQLVVGHMLGAVLLGYYVLAFNLSSWPVSMFSQPLRSVAPALFARLQHEPTRMREDFLRVLRLLCVVALPACAVLAVSAPELIHLVYGDDWGPAAEILRLLAVLAAVRILFELVYDFLVVLGRSQAILVTQVACVLVLVPALWWSTGRWGTTGAAGALLVVTLGVTAPLYLVQLHQAGLRTRDVLAGAAPGLALAGLAAASTALLLDVVPGLFAGLAASGLAVAAVVGVGVRACRSDLSVWGDRS
jgi:O-antigen/teichoic acid export membrane protein